MQEHALVASFTLPIEEVCAVLDPDASCPLDAVAKCYERPVDICPRGRRVELAHYGVLFKCVEIMAHYGVICKFLPKLAHT